MRYALALLIAAFAAVAIAIGLAFACGGVSPILAIGSLVLGLAVGVLAFRQMPPPPKGRPIHPVEWALIGVFAFVCLRAFLWLIYEKDNLIHVLSPNNLGDLPLHLDFIRYLASGVHFWPDSPIFSGEPLKYPIGADFFNSLLLSAGLPVERGLLWVALGGSVLAGMALWRWGRGFALAAFLFGGGLTAFALLKNPSQLFAAPLPDLQSELDWKNLFLAIFVTQRGLLFALPAGLFLLDYWRTRYFRREKTTLPTWGALVLYGTLPLFNVHAFLFLSVVLAAMFAFASSTAARKESFLFVAMAFLPATLCAALVTGGFSAGGGVHLEIGWLQPKDGTTFEILWYWLRNFGLYLVLTILLLVVSIIRGPSETRALVVPSVVMFLVCCVVSFAPWPWDNTKIMIWCWLAVAPCLWTDLISRQRLPLRIVICFVLFLTGAISLAAGLDQRHGYSIVDATLVRNTASAVKTIPPEARFASAPEYQHPLIIMGRKVAMGYDGHLWSHGITYEGRNQDKVAKFQNLMMGGPGWEQDARDLRIDYLYWGQFEERRFPFSRKPWSNLPTVAVGDGFAIYALPH